MDGALTVQTALQTWQNEYLENNNDFRRSNLNV